MITYIKGDAIKALKDGEITCLAHGCNNKGMMGAGIAKQIREQFPAAYQSYYKFIHDLLEDSRDNDECTYNSELLGLVDFYRDSLDRVIANCFTQDLYGNDKARYLNYEALHDCLEQLYLYCQEYKLILGMPKIGAGLAGGNWKIIECMINEVFYDIEVKVYEL